MRVAVLAGSITAGIRMAKELETLNAVETFIVVCSLGRRPLMRWAREVLLAAKSSHWWTFTAKLYGYAKSGKLVILRRSLDDRTSTDLLRSLKCDVGLHAANVIYREPTISAFRLGILNAHIGILPKYRGRSVAEWSILQGDPTGVTVFFIDPGIDTGARILLREFVPPNGQEDVWAFKNELFAHDARLYRKALEVLLKPEVQFESNAISEGKRHYVMSKVLTSTATEILRQRRSSQLN
jgi:methionyl-tRNA formyltransferase